MDEIIDVRSPAEFAEDHLFHAVNLPVLTNEEREMVGILYTQESAFKARKLGAALVSHNIAQHLDSYFSVKPREYRPLLYCWRGGMRSRSLAMVLREIGWNPVVLEGGYKSYRRSVLAYLQRIEDREVYPLYVLAGMTGVGKTQLLKRMEQQGLQVIDLEELAQHRGSLFGENRKDPQPTQKYFETLLYEKVKWMRKGVPIFIESESRNIGKLQCPEPLWKAMVRAPVIEITASLEQRVRGTLENYAVLKEQEDFLLEKVALLKAHCGAEKITYWSQLIQQKQWPLFVKALLLDHYDQVYGRPGKRGHFQKAIQSIHLPSTESSSMDKVILQIHDAIARLHNGSGASAS